MFLLFKRIKIPQFFFFTFKRNWNSSKFFTFEKIDTPQFFFFFYLKKNWYSTKEEINR